MIETAESKSLFRLRNWFIWLVPILLVFALFKTDPDKSFASTMIWALRLCVGVFVVASLAHLCRRFLADYPEADFQRMLAKAMETSEGAGRAAMAIAIIMAALLMVVSTAARAQDVRTFVPSRCAYNLQYLKDAQHKLWADHPDAATLAALAEHESCVSLKSTRCCAPGAQLKNAREEGAGIPQLTRTYRSDGSLRFDALAELRELHPVLRELTWENVYQRPDLQNDALVLKAQDNYKFFLRFVTDKSAALDFADGGYNAGNGRMQADRRACQLAGHCDPGQYVNNVERFCTASHAALYGQRSACDIYHHHVEDVRRVRTPKYRSLMT